MGAVEWERRLRRVTVRLACLLTVVAVGGLSFPVRLPPPPIAPRDDDCVTWVGKVIGSPGSPPRQASHSNNTLIDPPRAIPNPYGWMRTHPERAKVYIEEHEHPYTESGLGHLEDTRNQLFEEYNTSLTPVDRSLPYRVGRWWYYSRESTGMSCPEYCRAPVFSENETVETILSLLEKQNGSLLDEEVIVNLENPADGNSFVVLRSYEYQPYIQSV